ncbi:MAG TPA: hypothetical protein DCY07_03465, partial [Rhodospirillaceae bacterium]|nr:hypothetical protein [Rhodospirillaceae bacterium]
MSYTTALSFDLSPVRLSYVAALRSVLPKKPSDDFCYAQTGAFDLDALLCLAASNPQGTFFAVAKDADKTAAQTRGVSNITFVSSPDLLPTNLDYLVCEQTDALPSPTEREALFSLAKKHLSAGGLLAYRYRAYQSADDALRFLVAEFAPEMSAPQALDFLTEIKALGALYFADHPIARDALDKAIAEKNPTLFFDSCGNYKDSASGAFAAMEGLLPRDFSFAGDADIGTNYLELSAPNAAHETLGKCREHLLYEPIKDFALQRLIRNDIWVKRPAEQTVDPAELFGHFTFGITTAKDRVPSTLATKGGSISFQTPLFTRLIEIMTTLPMGIGDFLAHPAGYGMDPAEVVAAIHVLVACGIASPMRARYEGKVSANTARPTWATSFNEYLSAATIAEPTVRLASSIVGGAVTLCVRDALVLQAIRRVGLSNSAGALLPELEQLVQKNPALAAQIMDTTEPTD